MHDYTLLHAIRGGWFVLTLLGAASMLSITIIVDRWILLRSAQLDAGRFARAVLRVLREGSRTQAVELCRQHRQPIADVVLTLLAAPGSRDERERAFRHTLRIRMRELQTRVPMLGTIGSISPFVGLFGTVWGIMKAFRDIALNTGGGPGVVSAGISEALITTAVGLLVAIPAIIAYNGFTTSIRRLAEEIDLTANELLDDVMRLEQERR